MKYFWIDQKFQRKVKRTYYNDPGFFYLDQDLLAAYFFKTPYAISKKYLKERKEKNIYVYGETPLHTYEKIGKKVGIKPKDLVLELGSGRGRGAFFVHHFFKCPVVAIERILHFVKVARYLSRKYCREGVRFICADMLETDLPKATVLYLYGTALSDEEVALLIKKLEKYPTGTKIVSISYPLSDYHPKGFCTETCFSVAFNWGITEAYVETVR